VADRQQQKPGFLRGIPLFTILGFEVRLNLSWLVLGLLIAWTLAEGFVPERYPDLSRETRWWMGGAGAVGILFSIVFHELSHSLVGRLYGLPIGGITLFVFGGVAEMRQEPSTPRSEFLMAGAGPLSSLLLAGVFYGIEWLAAGWPVAVTGVLHYLAIVNVALAIFNTLPAYPLDGGRMLRAALWHWQNDLEKATRIASRGGAGFGVMLMILGGLSLVAGDLIGGVWLILIGLFVRGAAQASYRQLLTRRFLEGRTVAELMDDAPGTVSPETTLAEFLERHVYRKPHRLYPVVKDSKLEGCITVDRVKGVPEDERRDKTVGDVMDRCSSETTVQPGDDAKELVDAMLAPGAFDRKLVVDGDRLVGAVSLDDLRRQLAVRLEFES